MNFELLKRFELFSMLETYVHASKVISDESLWQLSQQHNQSDKAQAYVLAMILYIASAQTSHFAQRKRIATNTRQCVRERC